MKDTNYVEPLLRVEEVEVEKGYNMSEYGDYGEAGQQSGYIDYGNDGFYF